MSSNFKAFFEHDLKKAVSEAKVQLKAKLKLNEYWIDLKYLSQNWEAFSKSLNSSFTQLTNTGLSTVFIKGPSNEL